MAPLTRNADWVRLHVGPGDTVWAAHGNYPPRSTGRAVAEYLADTLPSELIRILAWDGNLDLIVGLYEQSRQSARIEVAGLQTCETGGELEDPQVALYRSRQVLLSASLGGWRVFTDLDYPAYKMASLRRRHGGVPSDEVVRLLPTHPAWRRLRFLCSLDQAMTANVISRILDPGRFVDPAHPDRLARLHNYMGLMVGYQLAALRGSWQVKPTRYREVTKAWMLERPVDNEDYARPGNFLWRRWLTYGSGTIGELRASRLFLRYLVCAWQQGVMERTQPWRHDPVFEPSLFMSETDVRAYHQLLAADTPA